MNAWNGTGLTPLSTDPVLVIGPDGAFQRTLSREIESLPAAVMGAESISAAAEEFAGADRPPSIMLLPEGHIHPIEFEAELAELRVRLRSPELVPIAFGRAPDDARREEIREAGVDLALFGRFGRHALRFQINRALSSFAEGARRGELRAPKEWRTRTYSSGREKRVRCYSLSSRGAYFVTPRPWIVGSEIALELPLGLDRLLVSGSILYTNVGDDTARPALPRGMAVAFRPLSKHIRKVIRKDVTAAHQALEV
jgi:hypothetical protein